VGDVDVGKFRPHLRVRPDAAKRGRTRRVPLWWDVGTLADLVVWKAQRLAKGVNVADLFLRSRRAGATARPLSRHTLRRRFLTACRVLGLERIDALTIHHGRHTFISHALAGGRTLAEVRDAAGHSNVSVTLAYLHVAADGDEGTGELFRF